MHRQLQLSKDRSAGTGNNRCVGKMTGCGRHMGRVGRHVIKRTEGVAGSYKDGGY